MELPWKITNEKTTDLTKIGILLKHHFSFKVFLYVHFIQS